MDTVSTPLPKKREFLPNEFKITVWSKLKPYYNELLNRSIDSVEELEKWIADRNELEAIVSESLSWRYIHVSADSTDQKAAELYQYAIQELAPRIASFENQLNQKLINCSFIDELDPENYFIYIRNIRNISRLFREENLPLSTTVQLKSKEYGKIFAEMTIGIDGKQMTLQKAGTILEETDRTRREAVFHKIHQRILENTDQLEDLFDDLLQKRDQIALNAGFDNFRDYKFQALGRFDYTVQDCCDFHDSILFEILPIIDRLNCTRKEVLQLDRLRPWDLHVDTCGAEPLRPFQNVEELVEKAIQCLSQLHPSFGEVITIMQRMGHLDLDSRKGKRPGGYNMPLHATGVPFIFMNATNSLNDMRTLLHESGHAIHSFLTRDYRLNSAKRFPSEVAELAAMSMELLTMDHWNVFFPDDLQLTRARILHLENVLKILPWIAAIDKYQHWVYTHPQHSREERKKQWMKIYTGFYSSIVDGSDLEHYSEYLWHRQLHVFEVPFYYIEYGMAQLGAIAIWKRYRENPQQAVKQYIEALRLGYTRPIREIYQTAGISFDFSRAYIGELGAFVQEELQKLLLKRSAQA